MKLTEQRIEECSLKIRSLCEQYGVSAHIFLAGQVDRGFMLRGFRLMEKCTPPQGLEMAHTMQVAAADIIETSIAMLTNEVAVDVSENNDRH